MDQRLKTEGGLGRSPAVGALTAAAAGAVLLIPLPFIGVPLSFVALVIGVAYLRGSNQVSAVGVGGRGDRLGDADRGTRTRHDSSGRQNGVHDNNAAATGSSADHAVGSR